MIITQMKFDYLKLFFYIQKSSKHTQLFLLFLWEAEKNIKKNAQCIRRAFMKIRSLTMALYLSMATMAIGSHASVAAHHSTHCDLHRIHETTVGLSKDLLDIFSGQNSIFAYEGALSNSDSESEFLVALITRETQHLNDATSRFLLRLRHLGVSAAQEAGFATLMTQMFALGWEYTRLVRFNASQEEQLAAANAWETKARQAGAVLASFSNHDLHIIENFGNIVVIQTQNVQAFRQVLVDGLIQPANPASEGIAAVELNEEIIALGNDIALRVVRGFCRR